MGVLWHWLIGGYDDHGAPRPRHQCGGERIPGIRREVFVRLIENEDRPIASEQRTQQQSFGLAGGQPPEWPIRRQGRLERRFQKMRIRSISK